MAALNGSLSADFRERIPLDGPWYTSCHRVRAAGRERQVRQQG